MSRERIRWPLGSTRKLRVSSADEFMAETEVYSAHNYAPLDVVLSRAEGVWAWDVSGNKYLDLLSGYSALNFGHRHPRLVAAAKEQLDRITLTSRAFYNDQLGPLCHELAELCGLDKVLLMNSGAEAVETALKAARKWGYEVKGIPPDKAEIICFAGNFHGRTTTIVSFSDSELARKNYGPYTPGFVVVPFGDIDAVKSAMNPNTVGVLVEPIQGEGGVIIPPIGFLCELAAACIKENVLFLADEVQTGFGRTGELFCCDHERVKPDIYILGKSLGGGIVPISAVVGRQEVMDVFTPGSHGSTFGGNPFACAIAREVVRMLKEEKPWLASAELGKYLLLKLREMNSPFVADIRGCGLFVGMDIRPEHGLAKDYCKKLKSQAVLCKDTRDQTIRFAPPLIISKSDLDWGLERIADVFKA